MDLSNDLSSETTRSAELERRFDELESRLAEVRQLAMQSSQGPLHQNTAAVEHLGNFFHDDGRNHDTWADFLDFGVMPEERPPTSPLFREGPQSSRSPGGTTTTSWHKAIERAGTRRRLLSQPSIYDMDLLELHSSVRYQLLRQSMTAGEPQQSLDTLVQKMLYLLASDRYWGGKRRFWFETLAFEKLAPITRYQIMPTVEHYQAIQEEFQPTQLQLTRYHWPMVDWIPYASLRDKIILHADEIDLAAVVEGTLESWCLESKVVVPLHGTLHETLVYYRLSEYLEYRRQQHADPASLSGTMSKSVETEFVLALRQPTQVFKLERSYFDRFPMLFCEDALAKGQYSPVVIQQRSPESHQASISMSVLPTSNTG